MKIIDFIKNNKVPTVVASVVLVAAIAVGVTFGVLNHKDNIETNEPFGNESSSKGSSSTISVPPIEGNSSEENTSSEDSTSSASETIETNSTPSNTESVSSAQGSSKPTTTTTKPASSQPSNTTSSAPVTSTPSNSGGGNSGSSAPSTGGNTGTSTKWVCPDPSAHPQESAANCIVEYDHKSFVAQYQEQEANKDKTPTRNPEDVGVKCWICGRPFGDGYNGTCLNYFCDGSYKCHHYDTGETCQIKHGG